MPRKAEYDRIKADPVRYAKMLADKARYRREHGRPSLSPDAKERRREYKRRWRERNPGREYKGSNDDLRLYNREYRRIWREENRERDLETQRRARQRRAADPERHQRHRENERRWREANPDKMAIINAKIAIRAATGLKIRDIPPVLAEAKALEMTVRRELKNLS